MKMRSFKNIYTYIGNFKVIRNVGFVGNCAWNGEKEITVAGQNETALKNER